MKDMIEFHEEITAIQRWRMAFDTISTAPFVDPDPKRTESMFDELQKLLSRHRNIHVRFSAHTGMIRSLRGELFPDEIAKNINDKKGICTWFLESYGKTLFGAPYQYDFENWHIVGSTLRVSQIGHQIGRFHRDNIYVYGGSCIFNFNGRGQLSLITSSLYPIPANLHYNEFREPSASTYKKAMTYVKNSFPSADKLEWDPQKEPWVVILPWIGEKQQAQYIPAWILTIREQSDSGSWRVLVNADVEKSEYVLDAQKTTVDAPVKGWVYPSNEDALQGSSKLEHVALVQDVSSEKLTDAPYFKMKDEGAYQEPTVGDGLSDNQIRSANVYYHLCRALEVFKTIAANAWNGNAEIPVSVPGDDTQDTNNIRDVYMGNQENKIANYNYETNSFFFYKGQPNSETEVRDPTYDCEVIYHEYTHAVFGVVQPDIWRSRFDNILDSYNSAINEAIAIYFGCTLSERCSIKNAFRWAEYAYAGKWQDLRVFALLREENQQADFDYLQIYSAFPKYNNSTIESFILNNLNKPYVRGMIWARTLWDIRRLLGYDVADAIILRSLTLLGGLQSELETPAEAIILADHEYAANHSIHSHKNALRLIFCGRGIAADAPVHDLQKVIINDQSYLLAATENTTHNNMPCGCMFSDDHGDTWIPLGDQNHCPVEVVALAISQSAAKIVVWAACEEWVTEHNSTNQYLTGSIYRYELYNSANAIVKTDGHWEKVCGNLPDKAGILSMIALRIAENDDDLLFVGTEIGLYKYEKTNADCWTEVDRQGATWRVFDMARVIKQDGQIRLAIVTYRYIYAFDPDTLELDSELKKSVYGCLSVLSSNGHLWVGSTFKGIYHFDLQNNGWEKDESLTRPIHCLLQGDDGTLYAGTNNGVYYQDENEGWKPFYNLSEQNSVTLEGTTAVALCRIKEKLLAGTTQRGIWREKSDKNWERLAQGLPRIGYLSDKNAPLGRCEWNYRFEYRLSNNEIGTYVLYIPQNIDSVLSFEVVEQQHGTEQPDVIRELYFVAPYIDPDQQYWAGLQTRSIDQNLKMINPVQQGFYVLKMTAGNNSNNINNYTVTVKLTCNAE